MHRTLIYLLCVSPLLLPINLTAKDKLVRGSVEVLKERNASVSYLDKASGYVFEDQNFNSRFDLKDRGIAGVKVSNGIDVVLTDEAGYYEIAARDNMSLFISKPAGFSLPVDQQNIPQFYYHHLPEGSPELRFGGIAPTGALPNQINFPLYKTAEKSKFKIVVSGDTQPYSNSEVGYVRDSLAKEVAALPDIDFVMIEGDVIGDDLSLYPRFKDVMSLSGVPLYLVPGNHDIDFDAKSDAHSLDTFRREFGPAYYSFDMGQVHFVVLDNVRYPCRPELDNRNGDREFCNDPENNPTYNGVIPQEQMQWLSNDLRMTPKDKLIVINTHIPLVSFVDMDAGQHQVDNINELYELLQDRKALALSGHTHTTENIEKGEFFAGWSKAVGAGPAPFHQIITGATAGSWWSGDLDADGLPMAYQRDGAPRGYFIFEFDGADYKETFKAAGRPLQEQMHADFLTPSFRQWYNVMQDWMRSPTDTRSSLPPLTIHDLEDTSILSLDDLQAGVDLRINVWNGSKKSKVTAQINRLPPMIAERTQAGLGEGVLEFLDPAVLKRQMYVFRYAAASEHGDPRSQGFELFRGNRFGPAAPQPLPEWLLTRQSNHLWSLTLPADLPVGKHILSIRTIDRYGRAFSMQKPFEVVESRPSPMFNSEAFR